MVMSPDTDVSPKDTAPPLLLTVKLPVTAIELVIKDPCVCKFTAPALCRGPKLSEEDAVTDTLAQDPPLPWSNVTSPAKMLFGLVSTATWLVPVSAVKLLRPPMFKLRPAT